MKFFLSARNVELCPKQGSGCEPPAIEGTMLPRCEPPAIEGTPFCFKS